MSTVQFRAPFSSPRHRSRRWLLLLAAVGVITVGIILRFQKESATDIQPGLSSDAGASKDDNAVRLDGHVSAAVRQDRQALLAGYAPDVKLVLLNQERKEERFENLFAIRDAWETILRTAMRRGGTVSEEQRLDEERQGMRAFRIVFPNQTWTRIVWTARFNESGGIVEEYLDIQEGPAIVVEESNTQLGE